MRKNQDPSEKWLQKGAAGRPRVGVTQTVYQRLFAAVQSWAQEKLFFEKGLFFLYEVAVRFFTSWDIELIENEKVNLLTVNTRKEQEIGALGTIWGIQLRFLYVVDFKYI